MIQKTRRYVLPAGLQTAGRFGIKTRSANFQSQTNVSLPLTALKYMARYIYHDSYQVSLFHQNVCLNFKERRKSLRRRGNRVQSLTLQSLRLCHPERCFLISTIGLPDFINRLYYGFTLPVCVLSDVGSENQTTAAAVWGEKKKRKSLLLLMTSASSCRSSGLGSDVVPAPVAMATHRLCCSPPHVSSPSLPYYLPPSLPSV